MSGSVRGRVLVADDHRLIVRVLQRTLEDDGYCVVVEMAADRVAAAVRRERPDVAIVDAQMDPHERFFALASVQQLEARRPPVIVLSAHDDPAIRARALELGADAFLSKPWDHGELVELIERLRLGAIRSA